MIKQLLSLILVLSSCISSLAQEITGFSLITTVTNTFLVALSDGDSISLATYGDQLSIRADTTGAVGSLRFDFDGTTNRRTENVAPYALNGDAPTGVYQADPLLIQPGTHVITATIFSATAGGGTALATRTITVNTIAETSPPPPPNPCLACPPMSGLYDVPPYNHGPTGAVTGELRKWHKVTLGFDGPTASEGGTPNPFTDYRFDVTFTHEETNTVFIVPGYFAADGDAANTGATSGNVWLVHFSPNLVGTWLWSCSFLQGPNVAQNGGGTDALFMNGLSNRFVIGTTDKTGRDHRGKGRLSYVDEHHLQFQETSEWFIKAGADSPENFLAYNDFDNTPNNGNRRKDWSPHLADYRSGDPTWAEGKGQSIIGAINYLALEKGMNVFSFLPMNIAGDDKNVFPYVSDAAGGDRQRIDVSKTAQWEVVFEHADHIGMYLHFKTQETENDQLLDGGDLGLERRLYYRELIARFGHHLALNWNIGEENTNTDEQRMAFADYFKAFDPYDSPIVVHTYPSQKVQVYTPLLGHPSYDGVSIQTNPNNVFADTLYWVDQSNNYDKKWVVANDEQGNANVGVVPDANDPDHDVIRKNVLWANLMAGGAGVEYYFGYGFAHSDLTCNDFRSRDVMWTQSRYALDFFHLHVPLGAMTNRNDLVASDSAWCLANSEVYVIYLRNGGTTTINLPDGEYTAGWFDPRNGGDLQNGSRIGLTGGTAVQVGNAPNSENMDWAVVIKPNNQIAFCFSADSTVEVLNQGTTMMKDLKIGDSVRTADGTFERVYSFGHYAPNMLVEYYQIHLVGMDDALEISRDHMVFRDDGVAVPASLLEIGDSLHLVNDGGLVEVRDITTVWKQGAYAPFTTSGTIAVNGIAASSYISLQSDSHLLTLGDSSITTPLSMQWLAHTFESAHRLICWFHFDYCTMETYESNGLSRWIAKPLVFSQWLLSQNVIVMLSISVPALLVGLVVRLIETGVNSAFTWNPF